MIAELGLAALWLAAAVSLLQLTVPSLGLWRDDERLWRFARPAGVVQALLGLLSFVCLIRLFAVTDLSVRLVAMNSHPDKPFLYKISGTWGNHEGSMLLWVAVLALAGGAIAALERRVGARMVAATLAAQAAISLGFYAFLLFASNPFTRLDPPAETGAGLNPLLQDPGLAFHPPTLYIGYVGLSVAFSYAIAAMALREVGPAFARAMRPWVLGAWSILTVGIVAGSYWAYYELGWGGYWFWDPVENASLMPWLAATALLHSVTVLATRDALRAWTVMLGVVAFSMSMVGTFLVRSGILTSVHAFAVDPRRGSFILALLVIYIGAALALFAFRAGTVREGAPFAPVSREGGLVINNLILSAILGVVFVGTLYPLAAEAMSGVTLSVGPPYFNATAAPLGVLLAGLVAAGPLLQWRKADPRRVVRRLAVPALLAGVATLAIVAIWQARGVLITLAFAVGIFTAVASFLPLFGRSLKRTPFHIWGMVLSHLGVAVAILGMASNAAFTKEALVAARPGDSITLGGFNIAFDGVEPVAGPNWTAIQGNFTAVRGDGAPYRLHPQARTFTSPMTETTEAAIRTLWNGQLYAVLGKADAEGRWQVHIWWKPFVTLIWLGGLMVAAGGLVALGGRLRRERRYAR
ncbi:c-type cytochrome biogenesis protein CcmF [Tardibacter chloracetimidivorans]|uniref:C-type cytochrome biogenesis protein CcmF n=1 Tax=Tardibacter chloracetimidivorans TaxID=1921510 RepID=A0A1L3ZTX2_9SPHN|nr:heme lyase CcmF/NrfE family subunit [Tardibacter chloracetimidivorans]API59040.1 c-type cytochrome biogenesis protein CcmF [Tardibacter chloracetimidivorans]